MDGCATTACNWWVVNDKGSCRDASTNKCTKHHRSRRQARAYGTPQDKTLTRHCCIITDGSATDKCKLSCGKRTPSSSSSCVACTSRGADISLQSGRICATVIASSRERLFDLRSCWIVFIHVVRGRPGGLLQFSEREAVMIFLASVSSGILAMWPNRERRCAWTIADKRTSAFLKASFNYVGIS